MQISITPHLRQIVLEAVERIDEKVMSERDWNALNDIETSLRALGKKHWPKLTLVVEG